MDDIFTNLKQAFSRGDILTKLIFINVGVFVVLHLADIVMLLLNMREYSLLTWMEMPSYPPLLADRPWTPVTYMFTHWGFLHLLFNMLVLYWFGRIFLETFNPRQLGGLYLEGGIGGALLFILAYNLLPYYRSMAEVSTLIGASAAVMAIVFASAFYRRDYEIRLLFIGRVKLLYFAIGIFILDMLSIASDNAGGHLAHIGGAMVGIWFASSMRKGHDLTAPIAFLLDRVVNIFRPKPKKQVTHGRQTETKFEYHARKNEENRKIDEILDKLKHSGYSSLSADEKKTLFDASNK
jgi:membrane associated rhomboid family serine protease